MEWRGKLNLKTEEKSLLTVLCCRWLNKVSCKYHSNTPDISMHTFLKEAKRKQKWIDLHQDSQTGLPTEYFALCFEHFEVSCFSRSVLIGKPVNFKRFYFEKGSIPSIYVKPKDSLDTDYPRNAGRLANQFFPRNALWMFLWDPTMKRQYPKSPSPKKSISFQIG